MSRIKHGLAGLVDSDSDDEFAAHDSLPTPDFATENQLPGKRGLAKTKGTMPAAKVHKVTKTKAASRRTSGRATVRTEDVEPTKSKAIAKVTATKKKRKALADKSNQQEANDTEEVDEFDQDIDVDMVDVDEGSNNVVAVKQVKSRAVKKVQPGRGRPPKNTLKAIENGVKTLEDVSEIPQTQIEPVKPTTKASGKRQPIPEPHMDDFIQETQVDGMQLDRGDDEEEEEGDVEEVEGIVEETLIRVAPNVRHPRPKSRTHPTVQPRRAGSASDTERGDPALRRKLGDMTKKFDILSVKYNDLREIGVKEAERNFERLRKQGQDRAAASDKLIMTLKAEIASQASLAKESRALKKKVETQTAEMVALKAQVSQMTSLLSDAHAENKKSQGEVKKVQAEIKKVELDNKTLSTKLAANRSAAASVESANVKVPGSAVKANGGIRMMGSAEAAMVAQAAQLKEDLYSDLTGLIIRNVKREVEDDVFDCIQTGRNGTLHFKLAITNDKGTESYDDAQCQYVPQLDPSRDKALIELLPDYLVEEITFPRPQAARFYARVGKALMEKIE